MTAEPRPGPRPGRAVQPLRLERLGTELPDPGDVADQLPDPPSRRIDMNAHRPLHVTSIRGARPLDAEAIWEMPTVADYLAR